MPPTWWALCVYSLGSINTNEGEDQSIIYTLLTITPGDLCAAIERDFGSVDNFRTQMSAKTVAVQGSGWGWLVSIISYIPVISG